MDSRFEFIDIEITDFVEDAIDEGAFAVNFKVMGPDNQVDILRVSFTDEFIQDYFRISWRKDLGKTESQLEATRRELFIKWAIGRIERWLLQGRKEKNLQVDADEIEWAKKIDKGTLHLVSEKKDDRNYSCVMERRKRD